MLFVAARTRARAGTGAINRAPCTIQATGGRLCERPRCKRPLPHVVSGGGGGEVTSEGGPAYPRAIESRKSLLALVFFIRVRRKSIDSAGAMSERKLRSR